MAGRGAGVLVTGLYRKKPVEVTARCVSTANVREVADWCHGVVVSEGANVYMDGNKAISISTLEGVMYADYGDWVIRGVEGEFYPCKPAIFLATYEAIS